MRPSAFSVPLAICLSTILVHNAQARPQERHELTPTPTTVDIVGDVDGTAPAPAKAALDTLWIATWNFEGCDDTGWVRSDNRLLNDGNVYWSVHDSFDGLGNIAAEAAAVGAHNLCWVIPDGYGNDWYQGICIHYVGDSFLSFDYLVESERLFDFLQVEADSACSSFARVDFDVDPLDDPRSYRDLLWDVSGFHTSGARADSIALPGFASNDTHCVYIGFIADGAYSPADGLVPSTLGVATVVDNVLLEGAMSCSEDFTDFTATPWFSFVNMHSSTSFGTWSRTYQHISDNDLCTENPGCAWLASDDTTPTLATHPSMAFGPGSYVVKNWLDDALVGPWVSLSSTASAVSTVVQFRRFGGNFFAFSRIAHNWSIQSRSKIANTDTPAPGDSVYCPSGWGFGTWNSLTPFRWQTLTWDATAGFDSNAEEIQMRFRISDWQYISGSSPPTTFRPGPGPYWDRVRIGRLVLNGPLIDAGVDARSQAQDAAPNNPAFEAGPLYTQAPGGDIFGTTAFSRSGDLGTNNASSNLIVGDSITVEVQDVLGHGGLTVEAHFAIVAGPHAGKAPPPYVVQANGFFVVSADSARNRDGTIVADRYFVDLDDTYFRGGDKLLYFWWATDAQGGTASLPAGLTSLPSSWYYEAEVATGGLFEVSFLPDINWDASYLARIAADPNGDLDPTPVEIANSQQKNCILYYQNINARRRSSHQNRTSFMYKLDEWGYAGHYDVYDHTGIGNTNNALGSRMSPEQAKDYSILIYDAGNRPPGTPILPDGSDLDSEKINMEQWFHTWNALSGAPNAPHTLWIISANAMQEKPASTLYNSDMGATFQAGDQALDVNPDVFGIADFTNHGGCSETHIGDAFAVHGGCPAIEDFDDIGASGTGVLTHVYGKGTPGQAGAMVMNANAGGYSTILQTFPWSDISVRTGQHPSTSPAGKLLLEILSCALPGACQPGPGPTDVDPEVQDDIAVPAHTMLRQNHPNPFNPMTTIRFDLALDSHVSLSIYNVAGRMVRRLANEKMTAGFSKQITWNGRDDSGRRVSSGVYFYRLEAGDFRATRKLVVMK